MDNPSPLPLLAQFKLGTAQTLGGVLALTLQSPDLNLQRDFFFFFFTVAVTVPLSLQTVCFMLSVYDYKTTNTRDLILLFELCLKKETSLKKKKKKTNQTPLKHAGNYFCFFSSHPLMFKMTVSVCVSVSEYARVVFLYVCKLQELLGAQRCTGVLKCHRYSFCILSAASGHIERSHLCFCNL